MTLKFKVKINFAADSLHFHQTEGVEFISVTDKPFFSPCLQVSCNRHYVIFELHLSHKPRRFKTPRLDTRLSEISLNCQVNRPTIKPASFVGSRAIEPGEIHLKTQLHARSAPARLSQLFKLISKRTRARVSPRPWSIIEPIENKTTPSVPSVAQLAENFAPRMTSNK